MEFHTYRINKPIPAPMKILLWFRGDFPTTNVSVDSFLLPKRIWPNAEITVRCRCNLPTMAWVNKVSEGKYRMMSDEISPKDIDFSKWDIVWNHDYWFIKKYSDQQAINEWKYILANVFDTELWSLYCDPLVLNKIAPVENRMNWGNVNVVFNQDIVEDYAPRMFDDKFSACTAKPNIWYINMKIYYNLPDNYYPHLEYSNHGCYFAHFHEPRLNFFRKVLPTFPEKVPIAIGGRGARKLETFSEAYFNSVICDKFTHDKIKYLLDEYDWGLYIGRCRPIPWLGMSFYLPLLYGLPIFCYTKAKEAQKVFGGLNCFFSTEDELVKLIQTTDLCALYKEQTKRIKSFY